MTFLAIFLGVVIFLIGFAVHVAWWRMARPTDDIRALAVCFIVAPPLLAGSAIASWPDLITLREAVAAVLVTFAIGAFYIMWYPAAQAASPTMLLVLQVVRSASGGGATRESLREAFDSELLCRQSIDNLVHQHFAEEKAGRLAVAPRGAALLKMLNSWRGFLGLKYGSG